MAGSPHYRELLETFNKHEVDYLIVGGYAVMRYSEPRYTKDLDVWVSSSAGNSRKVFQALAHFGAPLHHDGVTEDTFTKRVVYQLGVVPVRVDVSTHIDGVAFEEAWRNREVSTMFGVPVHFISLQDLIANKQAAGRSGDLADLDRIRKLASKGEGKSS